MQARAFLHTLGCRLNHAETEILAQSLQDAGYELVDNVEDADLCIVNTCTVTREADAKSRKAVRAFIRRNPRAYLVVTGCHVHVRPDVMTAIPGVDLVVGNANKLEVASWLPGTLEKGTDGPRALVTPITPKPFTIPPRLSMPPVCRPQIKIQDGCDASCAFCIVPRARGESRGRPLDDIVEEARHLAAHGAIEVVVTGLNVGAYACWGKRLVDVLDGIDACEGIRRIRVGSLELGGIDDELIARMVDRGHALVPFLHIPLQSGSDTVLARMGRTYGVDEFRVWIDRIAARVPDVCLGTDVLVGFPGETDAEFDETCRFLENSPL
ncbi:MAG: MiaB/RimO family radical SAM methylthiotransferase, partial [Candidatus Hydrogenedentes bacterium]|nr:MiaB/RimO family radical SAM methylthiotransferase [Candidatus Hydrogenedentota bacterium]